MLIKPDVYEILDPPLQVAPLQPEVEKAKPEKCWGRWGMSLNLSAPLLIHQLDPEINQQTIKTIKHI